MIPGFLLLLAGTCGVLRVFRVLRRDRVAYVYLAIGAVALAATYLFS